MHHFFIVFVLDANFTFKSYDFIEDNNMIHL